MLRRCVKTTDSAIKEAAAILSEGGLVAFPTETVYGLGADAANPAAVAGIYSAKGRPGDNPLILHIASPEVLFELTDSTGGYAQALIDNFWPGPLTLVVKKRPGLPPWLGGHPSGETETIGVRMPAHPVALAFIEASGCVVAAPSANKAGTPSPTQAKHVESDFADGSVGYILDGGPVTCGVESTVVDVTGHLPVVLRPGAITPKMITDVTGLDAVLAYSTAKEGDAPRSPGMKYRHYAPKAPMTLLLGAEEDIAVYISKQTAESKSSRMGILVTTQVAAKLNAKAVQAANLLILGDKSAPETIAKNLYARLREFNAMGVDFIYAEGLVEEDLGIAIMDRMKKAAEGRVIHV